MAETWRLRLYADDGTTIDAEFSTDPAHAHPYLIVPDQIAGQDVDLANGRAKIGGCVVEVVDVPITPADQDTGYVTSLLADANGFTARIGRRAHLEVLIGASYENVINGVVDDVTLHDSFSSYTISIKDQRENERRTRAFVRATTASVLPRGVIDGFAQNAESGLWLVDPTEPLPAVYTETGPLSLFTFPLPGTDGAGTYVPDIEYVLTPMMREVLRPNKDFIYDRIRLYWRNAGPGAFSIVEGLGASRGAKPRETLNGIRADGEGGTLPVQFIRRLGFVWPTGVTKPTVSADVEVIIGYAGTPTKDYPLHLSGLTFGELLQGLYDGDYSDEDAGPVVLYDSTAVLALTEPVLARVTEPLDDEDGIWKWTEDHIFKPLGAAPALDADGLVSPVRYDLPPDGASLLELDDTNCEPIPGWSHTGTDAINVVTVEYPRYTKVHDVYDPNSQRSAGDGLSEVWDKIEHWDAASIALLGEKPLKIKAVTLGVIGGTEDDPITGDVADEIGAQLAEARARQAFDRFSMGGQHFAVRVLRSALAANRVGDWCIGSCSWWPDYVTGERGPERLLQIVQIRHLDTAWSDVELVDAGPNNTPVGVPTLGTVTAATDGSVSIPVTAIAAGSEARVDYAINDTEPAAASPLWRFAGRLAATGTIVTPPAPAGTTVWVRARGEKEGRRPSAWTTAVSVAVGNAPRVHDVRLTIVQADGSAAVSWKKNAFAAGVRIYWESHAPEDEFTFVDDVDADADDLSYTFPANTVPLGLRLSVTVEPWTGFGGGAVSGTAGEGVTVSALRSADGLGVAEITSLQLVELEDNVLHVSLDMVNAQTWSTYERLGNWPTLDTTEDDLPDPTYLRKSESATVREYQHAADVGTWFVIAIPFNGAGDAGVRLTASLAITGTASTAGHLSGLSAKHIFPADYMRIHWVTNAAVDADDRYEVDVYRDGVLQVTGRVARMDSDGTSPGTAGIGGWRDLDVTRCTALPCTHRTFVYRVELIDTSAVFPDRIYSVSIAGYFDV